MKVITNIMVQNPSQKKVNDTLPSEDARLISVVVPVYSAEKILEVFCTRLNESLKSLGSYEIILVDDRSPDDSWKVMEKLAGTNPAIIAIRLSRNFGQHYAITAGLDISKGEWVVVMDCDLQDRPEEIPRLLDKAREGYDIVLARRSLRQDKPLKRFSSWLFYKVFTFLSGSHIREDIGSFRILRRPVVLAFCDMRERFRLFGGMIEWVGFETGYLDVTHDPRYEGKSSYNFRKRFGLALDGIISFSNRPLYFSVALGALMSLLASGYGIFLIINHIFVHKYGVPGWLTTVAMQALVGGLILVNLGISGIYLGRTYDQTKGRPIYVIDRVIVGSFDEESDN